MTHNPARRRLLAALAGLAVSGRSVGGNLLIPTPPQTAGPFYPAEPPLDDDNDLTRIRGQNGIADGEITDLTGHIRDVNGHAVSDVRIEIWQCDAHGRYRHPRERGMASIDTAFQGFGHNRTDPEGRYRFRTIKPVPYPGRTPHIHVAVFPDNSLPFVTQLYIRGEPGNNDDFIFQRIPVESRHLVVADFLSTVGGDAKLQASFDIILDTRDGTPAA